MADVVVVGAGVAGLATALFASRAGSHVMVLEADPVEPPAHATHSLLAWARPGVAQFGHGHSIHALARLVLLEQAPDVLDEMLAVGVTERRFGSMPPLDGTAPGDDNLTSLQARRSVFEWVLRKAATREHRVSIRSGTRVVGLAARGSTADVGGVVLDTGEVIEAPWVVDASGRRSALPRWLRAIGAGVIPEEVQDSPNSYYARHFRFRPGVAAPSGDWLFGPTGDLGFLRYALLLEDEEHFVLTINVPKTDRELKGLRDPDAWLRAARSMTALDAWLATDASDVVSPVYCMGAVGNVLRDFRRVDVAGVVPVGDALLHTNPTQGWGLSMALHHARDVAATVTATTDRGVRTQDLVQRLVAHGEPYFRGAAAEDFARARSALEPERAWEDPADPLFCRKVAYPQARKDPVLYRAVQRRIHLLDPPDYLTSQPDLVGRALELHRSDPARAAESEPVLNRPELLRRIQARTQTANL